MRGLNTRKLDQQKKKRERLKSETIGTIERIETLEIQTARKIEQQTIGGVES